MAYEVDPEFQRKLNELVAEMEQRWQDSDLWDGVDLDVVAADPVPELCVFVVDHNDALAKFIIACWTWEEAIRMARGTAIISGMETRVVSIA